MQDAATILKLRPCASAPSLVKKEKKFYIPATDAPLPVYSSLQDDALKHFWGNPGTRQHLMNLGFLTKSGDLIDIDQYRRKWNVITRELALAEKLDFQRRKDKQLIVDHQAKLRQRLKLERMRTQDISMLKQERREAVERARARFAEKEQGIFALTGMSSQDSH